MACDPNYGPCPEDVGGVTGGANWFDFAQGIVGKIADTYIADQRIQRLGDTGYYVEGQRGSTAAVAGGISSGMILLAVGAVVAVLLLKD